MSNIPRLLRFLLVVAGINLCLFMLLRLIFLGVFNNPGDPVPFATLMKSLYIGFKFDLRLSLLIILPIFLLGWIKPLNPLQTKVGRWFWNGYLSLAFFFVLVFYVTDFGYFAYLKQPLDASILRFFENFLISSQMVWQTYPVIWITLGVFVVVCVYTFTINRLQLRFANSIAPQHGKWGKTAVATLSTVLVLFGLFGKFSYYPLRWSDAFFSPHAFASAVTLNPVLHFFDTLKNRQIDFDIEATQRHYDTMATYLGVDQPNKTTLNFTRNITSNDHLRSKPNIVMVFLESFASYKTGAFGNPLNPTPHFDAIAKEAFLFKRFYTPHTGTARSVFAVITGLPDIEVNRTSSRNPLVVNQHTIVNAFKDYEKFYFLGGSANWGNVRGVLASNIPNLHIYEEGSYSAPRVDVWGISDLHLFEEANQVLRKQDKPFFAIIQTSGNHRPYTIPEDNRGFSIKKHDKKKLKNYGFASNGEYNSFRYMDHSLGFFMQAARKERYFDNTLFVFFGDHGISGFGGEHTPAFETQLDLTGLHVPFVIYGPKLLPQAKTLDTIASEVDILPTLARLATPSYKNTTLGRDLLDPRFDAQRYAFTITHGKVSDIGLLGDKFYLRINSDGTNKRLYQTTTDTPRENVIDQYPEKAKEMAQLCLGMYETIKYMLYHNNRE